jgi:orotate phosphoribosyltransferase
MHIDKEGALNVHKELEDKGCIYKGHFVGTSGQHLSGYCNLDPIFPHVSIVKQITSHLIEPFASDEVDTVVAPAVGAIPLAHWGAFHLQKHSSKPVFGVWADKVKPEGFAFERHGFLDAVKGKRVLILEDFINKMFSVRWLVRIVNQAGGIPIGVGAISTNEGVSAEAIGVPKLVSLSEVRYDTWAPEECRRSGLCFQKVPIVEDIGHGDDYKLEHPDYAGGYTELLA